MENEATWRMSWNHWPDGLSEQGKYLIHVQIPLLNIESALQLRVAEGPYHWNQIVHTQPQHQF